VSRAVVPAHPSGPWLSRIFMRCSAPGMATFPAALRQLSDPVPTSEPPLKHHFTIAEANIAPDRARFPGLELGGCGGMLPVGVGAIE